MKRILIIFAILILSITCSKKDDEVSLIDKSIKLEPYPISNDLPKNLKWLTNNKDPIFGSLKAKKGGTIHFHLTTFPLTLRYVGPDSNGSFRGKILSNRLSLTDLHPNTFNYIPQLATHWAFDKNGKTIYYKLDKDATWSDGVPITADDYIFTLEYMRSKHNKAPWYNTYYSEEFDTIKKYDDHTIAVVGSKKKPDLLYMYGMGPTPRHYYRRMDKNFVRKYNWAKVPMSGPYVISDVKKGKSITFSRVKNWWAKDKKYYRNCYNVDKIVFKVIRDVNTAFEYFRKGKLDMFPLTLPELWHIKSKVKEVDMGYIHKIKFYNSRPRPDYAIFLNQAVSIFKDKNVRYGFSHAMDIGRIIKKVLRGDYERLESVGSGYGKYSNTKILSRKYDLKKVEYYMKKAGWDKRGPDGIRVKDGKRFSVRVTYGAKHHQDRLVVLKESAKKAGIELKLQLLDTSAAFKTMLEKNHEVAWTGWNDMFRPQYWGQYHSINAFKSQTNNFSGTAIPELDELIEAYRAGMNVKIRATLSKQIQQMIHDEGATIPTFKVPYFREAFWRWWRFPKGYGVKRSDTLFTGYERGFGLFWFDPKLKKETEEAKKQGKSFPKKVLILKKHKE